MQPVASPRALNAPVKEPIFIPLSIQYKAPNKIMDDIK